MIKFVTLIVRVNLYVSLVIHILLSCYQLLVKWCPKVVKMVAQFIRDFLIQFGISEMMTTSRQSCINLHNVQNLHLPVLQCLIISKKLQKTENLNNNLDNCSLGVNFINVLRAHFSNEILAPKITKLCFGFATREKLLNLLLYENRSRIKCW